MTAWKICSSCSFTCLRRAGHGRNDAVGKQHAHEGTDERGADHRTEDRRRLVDRAHGLHHAQNGRDDTQSGKRVCEVLQRVLRFVQLVEVRLHRIVHDVLDRVNFQRARGHDDEGQGVADQVDQRLIGENVREFGKERRGLGVVDVAFQCHRAFRAQDAHQARGQDDRVDVILLVVLGALEHPREPGAERLEFVHRVAGDDSADRGAADDQHFMRNGVHDGAERATGEGEAAEHHHQQDDHPDYCKHG